MVFGVDAERTQKRNAYRQNRYAFQVNAGRGQPGSADWGTPNITGSVSTRDSSTPGESNSIETFLVSKIFVGLLILDLPLGIPARLFEHPSEIGVLTASCLKIENEVLDAQAKVVQ